jgi:hypothetical protein
VPTPTTPASGSSARAPQQREQRLRRRGLLRIPGHLDPERDEPERLAQQALDDPHRLHPRDGHGRLAVRQQAATDADAVVGVARDGEARERDDGAGGGEEPGERE